MSNWMFLAVCLCSISAHVGGMYCAATGSELLFDNAKFKTIDELFEWRGWTSESALHHFARKGDVPSIEWTLHNKEFPIDAADGRGYTPLCWAMGHNAIQAAQFLFEQGA